MHLPGIKRIPAQHLFHQRHTLFQHQNFRAVLHQPPHQTRRQRVLSNFEHRERAPVRVMFHQVVVRNPARDNAQAFIRSIRVSIEERVFRLGLKIALFVEQRRILTAGNRGQQHKLFQVGGQLQQIFGYPIPPRHVGARMRKPGRHPYQHRDRIFFGQFERIKSHIIGFLLVRWFNSGNQRELAEKARILFIL